MTANVIERQPQMQYEKYTIDTDRLTQRFQQKNMEQSAANEKSRRDTVNISEDARKALEELRKQDNIEIAGTVEPDRLCMELKVYEDYEKAVMAETREKVTSGNFNRHVDKMVSAYQKMKIAIEEKYTDADEYKKKQLELLDKAYENHSKLVAGFTETMYDLRDFRIPGRECKLFVLHPDYLSELCRRSGDSAVGCPHLRNGADQFLPGYCQ